MLTVDLKRKIENGGVILLLLAFSFGAFSHFYAWIKCQHGMDTFIIVNERTEDSFAVWEFINENLWTLTAFAALTLGGYFTLRKLNSSYALRMSTILAAVIITLWYSSICAYLGGKFLHY